MNQTSALNVNTKEEELLWNSKNQSSEERNHLKSSQTKSKSIQGKSNEELFKELKWTTLRNNSKSYYILRRDHTVVSMIYRVSGVKEFISKYYKC